MPSVSKKQHNFMAAVANNPAFAKKAGVPASVGSDFIKADKGRTFGKGGKIMAKSMPMFGGKESYSEELKEAKAIKSGKITPQQYAKAEGKEKVKPKQTRFAIGGEIPSFGRGASQPGMAKQQMLAQRMGRFGRGAPPPAQEMRAPMPTQETRPSQGTPEMQAQFAAMQQRDRQDMDARNSAAAAQMATQMASQYGKSSQAPQAPQAADLNPNNQFNPSMTRPILQRLNAATANQSAQMNRPPVGGGSNAFQAAPAFKKGGFIKSADGIASKGKTKAQQFSSGGRVSSRADGIATKGKTRGKMC